MPATNTWAFSPEFLHPRPLGLQGWSSQVCQGSMISKPDAFLKSSPLRVTSLQLCTRAEAAINQSIAGILVKAQR